jgi:hypothetical protein
MEVQKDLFHALLHEHAGVARDGVNAGAKWKFLFQSGQTEVSEDSPKSPTSEAVSSPLPPPPIIRTENDFGSILNHFRGLRDFKEKPLALENLVVTPKEGPSSLFITGGPTVISNYCMNESLNMLDKLGPNASAKWKNTHIEVSSKLPDAFPCRITSCVVKTSDSMPMSNDLWLNTPKHYRIERAFEFSSKQCTYKLKMVRETTDSDNHRTMKDASLGGARVTYEVELEWHDIPANLDDVFMSTIISRVMHICQIVTNRALPITKEEFAAVRQAYKSLVAGHIEPARSRNRPTGPGAYLADDITMMAPKPVTLEQRHLVPSSPDTYGGLNIWKNYCVTDKADGERILMYIDDKGDAYFINNDIDIQRASISFPKIRNTLLDGEYVSGKDRTDGNGHDLFAAFDIYFLDGEPVYKLPLATHNDARTRFKLMQNVCDSNSWKQAVHAAGSGSNTAGHELTYKKHYFAEGDEMKAKCKAILDRQTELPYEIDGLIFTPADLGVCGYYPGKEAKFSAYMKWDRVLKWKPPEQNTIDFLIKEIQPPIRDQRTNKLYRRFTLYTGYSITRSNPINVKDGLRLLYDYKYAKEQRAQSDYVEKEFTPVSYTFNNIDQVHIDQNSAFGKELQTGMIVEFSYDMEGETSGVPAPQRWQPLRIREDKTRTYQRTGNVSKTANDYAVATSIWRTIHTPVNVEMLTGAEDIPPEANPAGLDERILGTDDVYYSREIPRLHRLSLHMLNFHNNGIKSKLYQYAKKINIRADSLLELACGMAGDIQRWRDVQFRFVLGIDFVKDNICKAGDGAYARTLNQRNAFKVNGVEIFQRIVYTIGDCSKPIRSGECTDDSESKEVLSLLYADRQRRIDPIYRNMNLMGIAANNFSTVSCQFAVHYFFQSEEKLNGFLNNVVTNLRKDGVFIATFMDGMVVDELLTERNGKAEGKMLNGAVTTWAIIKRYNTFAKQIVNSPPDALPTDIYGKQVDIYLENTGRLITEFLVHMPTLISKMRALGMELVESQLFSHDFYEILRQGSGKAYNDVREMDNDEVQKQFSFLNRWVVFKKI